MLVPPDSSPLMRGKPHQRREHACDRGLIPAHAGKTRPRSRRYGTSRAHPRSRGENTMRPARQASHRGSSPLTQGKRRIILPTGRPVRLIPAHAGKTRPRPSPRPPSTAHPRSRGENRAASWGVRRRRGSSPLTRGKLLRLVIEGPAHRLIPAHAGKTCLVGCCI